MASRLDFEIARGDGRQAGGIVKSTVGHATPSTNPLSHAMCSLDFPLGEGVRPLF